MRKTFPLHVPGKADARVLDAIKHDIRKYVKRERRKPLPEGFIEWSFACKVGGSAALAEPVTLKEIAPGIDRVAGGAADTIYVEILATPSALRAPSGAA